MEDEKTKWSVTYTKHVKQKRKVYQDGFLERQMSTNKMNLYDECEKLLECRILKKDEVVSCGQSLTFNAYLVDVGDPERDCKPITDLNFRVRDKKISEQNLRNNSISSGDRKIDVKKKKAQLSPSQKFIRDFKKRELHKYGTPRSSPETTKSETTVWLTWLFTSAEWKVLYTSQVTQKAKKYHDGFLRLAACGTLGRQIMLFDETRKLLDSRFLRRDEVIRSGESVSFDGHLVEIVFKRGEVPACGACQNNPVTMESNITEWQVMYTTHVTRKAKKYHDGFLKLVISGSLQRQVKLYDEGRKLLNSRFLRKEEIIRYGESIAFDAHLVDIGEPQANLQVQVDVHIQENNHNVFQNAGMMRRNQNFLKADKSGKPQSEASSREIADSSCSISAVDGSKLSKDVPANKPLRDSIQILSILQRPMDVRSNDAGSTDNSMMGQLSSSKGLKGSDVVVDVPDGNQESCKKGIGGPNEVEDIENCPDLMSYKSMAIGPGDNRGISSEEAKCASKVDKLPSFDLGF
ncbi:hypothetical protein KPL71_006277 [Citrus sinensis]|uniref:Uncharacterized protein n=1 Tax=Citrus sinensis TaxID=2711 RepID=A0ACB8LNG0_CITSI|nr:hypothetical protein KPL71_006277 [Citrus sinensis]